MLPRRPSLTQRSATLFIAVPLFSALLATSAITARHTMDADVDHIISHGIAPMVAPNGAGGVAVVAQIGGRNLFFNYGFADQAEKRPITSDSLFNVGSVRKIFEATLVAQAVLRGELKLDEPVAKYVTELHGDYIRHITIGQLVSHTSGLLLPTDHPPWPQEHFSFAGFYDALNAWTPSGDEQPGKQRIYTHAGYVLLQLVLERRYGDADFDADRSRRDRAARHDIDRRAGARPGRPRHHEPGIHAARSPRLFAPRRGNRPAG